MLSNLIKVMHAIHSVTSYLFVLRGDIESHFTPTQIDQTNKYSKSIVSHSHLPFRLVNSETYFFQHAHLYEAAIDVDASIKSMGQQLISVTLLLTLILTYTTTALFQVVKGYKTRPFSFLVYPTRKVDLSNHNCID